ncbi:MAG: ferrous iron transport protein A [Galactobacillus timonensis]|uniref:FeoA family protein n=1 Tax=Galactobacillus timonensis TaxID=2041840 RepID=UPI00240A6653|nr:ferrous iron transport protein A [Galactobacillus timonensis]MDD5852394.1 ferrous iron transport protein A [Galactobacillus timonensis]MDD6370344.1 ferrous iron transport protein A [Galactobacillus timonensis]MDD6599029.1 ferrous iron transport protein A [Galactobacillus timonensis]
MLTLKEVKVGDTCRVLKINGEGALRRRIMDMGITKNTQIYVRKVAPLGDPIELTVRGYELTIRKSEAEMVEVEPAKGEAA